MCIAGSSLLASTSAQANVTVTQGGESLADSTNVLFDTDVTGNPIFGDLAGGAQDVIQFSSTTDQLVAEASGQARITSADFSNGGGAGGDTGGINQLTISAVFPPYLGFEGIQLNLNAEVGLNVNFTATDQFNNVLAFGPYTLGVGENRFTFVSDAAQFITSLSFTSSAGGISLQDVRQVRVGDLITVPGPVAGAGLPALFALGGFVWLRRRRASSDQERDLQTA